MNVIYSIPSTIPAEFFPARWWRHLHRLAGVLFITSLLILDAIASAVDGPITPEQAITLFNGKDLSSFYTWLPK